MNEETLEHLSQRYSSIHDIQACIIEIRRLQDGLREIASHSVCCDARHCADRVLAGLPPNIETAETK